MIRINLIGTALILVLVLWPLVITLVFWLFRTSFKIQFFISSVLVGFLVYYTPVVLHHTGALDNLDKEIREQLELWKLSFPLITTIFLSFFWGKIIKSKNKIKTNNANAADAKSHAADQRC